jgi:four helix bundle protein
MRLVMRVAVAARSFGMAQHATEQQLAWEKRCPEAITSDVLWKLDAYRAAMFLLHVARDDRQVMQAGRADPELMSQLIRSVGSISANLADGYSRWSRIDRLRFLGYALSSARECIPWYEALRDTLPDDVIDERVVLAARCRSLLLGLIRSLRKEGEGGTNALEH